MGALARQRAEPFLMSSVSHSCHKGEVWGAGKVSPVFQQQANSTLY